MVEVLDGLISVHFKMHNLHIRIDECLKIPILHGFWCHLVTWFHIQVVQLDLQEVGRILYVEEVVPAQAERDPGRDHSQQVLQHRPIERQ